MTRDEAIYLLKQIYTGNPNDKVALHMAIEALEKATPRRREDDERTSNILMNFGDIGSPTIKPLERKRGEWKVVDASEPRRYGCSNCQILSWDMTNYCSNCGADMRGAEDEI